MREPPSGAAPTDIEIYVRAEPGQALEGWIADALGITPRPATAGGRARRLTGTRQSGEDCEVLMVPGVQGGFTAVWFRAGSLPWPDDLACARTAQAALGVEVRCTAGSWDPDDPEDESYWQLTADGERRIPWRG